MPWVKTIYAYNIMASFVTDKSIVRESKDDVSIDMRPLRKNIPQYFQFISFYGQFAPQFDTNIKVKFKSLEVAESDSADIKSLKLEAMLFSILIIEKASF